MSDANKMVIERFLSLYNARAWDRLDEVFAPGYVHHSNEDELTEAQFVGGARWIIARLPDFTVEIADLVAAGDRVALRFKGPGTHQATFFGEEPSERTIVLVGTTIFRIADGRIAEDWEVMDEADLRRKVGAPDPA